MTLPVFYVPGDALREASHITVDGVEGRHAALVRRLRVGEWVRLTDGEGTLVEGPVSACERTTVNVDVHRRELQQRPEPRLVVVQGLPKGERAELAVSLLTEVGVDEIIPWAAQRCVVRWDNQRAHRGVTKWRSAARESAKQSRRVWWPQVGALASTPQVCGRLAKAEVALVMHEAADLMLPAVSLPSSGEVVLVVGPEGGLDEAELEQFESAGASAVRAGPSVMRTSTAGAVAAAVLLSSTRRWS